MKHLVTARQFSRLGQAEALFDVAESVGRKDERGLLGRACQGGILAALFYEPSLRTRLSFESAFLRLGGQVISAEAAGTTSSAAKGESLEDTIATVSISYADVIVLRHPERGAAARAAAASGVPVINGGDGDGEHPTQALLDLFTVRRELGRLHGLRVAVAGDLAGSRTVHSLLHMLSLCRDVELVLAAPPGLGHLPAGSLDGFARVRRADSLAEAIDARPDALYLTRLQRERHGSVRSLEGLWPSFTLTPELLALLPAHAAILHPLPRNSELPTAIDRDGRAAYFRQTAYGTCLRMALLASLYNGHGPGQPPWDDYSPALHGPPPEPAPEPPAPATA
jgi:aspartate carbamoyltransferase catalytic subunit